MGSLEPMVDNEFQLLKVVVDVAFKLLIDIIEFVDKLFKLLNVLVDVAFKLLIDSTEFVDKLFKLVISANPDKSGLFGIALLFKLVSAVPDPIISPVYETSQNSDIVILSFEPVVLPSAVKNCKLPLSPPIVVDIILQLLNELKAGIPNSIPDTWFILLSLVSTLIIAGVAAQTFNFPLTFALFKVVVPDTLNDDKHIVLLLNVVAPFILVDPETFNDETNVILL